MRIRLLGVGVKMGIVDGGHAQSDDVIRCPETFADHEYKWIGSRVISTGDCGLRCLSLPRLKRLLFPLLRIVTIGAGIY